MVTVKLLSLFAEHPYPILFLWVFCEQMGCPIPSAPLLIAAGVLCLASCGTSVLMFVTVITASLLADLIWFQLGRAYGDRLISLLLRLSLMTPASLAETSAKLATYNGLALIFAKFVPGMSTLGSASLWAQWYEAVQIHFVGPSRLLALGVLLVGRRSAPHTDVQSIRSPYSRPVRCGSTGGFVSDRCDPSLAHRSSHTVLGFPAQEASDPSRIASDDLSCEGQRWCSPLCDRFADCAGCSSESEANPGCSPL